MHLSSLLPRLQRLDTFRALVDRLQSGSESTVTVSVISPARTLVLAALHAELRRPMLLITPRPSEARRYADELSSFLPTGSEVGLFPETDALPYDYLPAEPDKISERLSALRLLCGIAGSANAPLVVSSVRAVQDRLMDPKQFAECHRVLRPKDEVSPADLIAGWVRLGYEPSPIVDQPGLFSRRGGVLDVFPPGGSPLRLEFWGNVIESLRTFDPATQRSVEQVAARWVGPAHEVLSGPVPLTFDLRPLRAQFKDVFARDQRLLAESQPFSTVEFYRGFLGSATLLDYLPSAALVVVEDPSSVNAAARDFELQMEHLHADLLVRGEVPPGLPTPFRAWSDRQIATPARLDITFEPDVEPLPFEHAPRFGGSLSLLIETLGDPTEPPCTVVVSQQVTRLAELLGEHAIKTRPVDTARSVNDGIWLSQGHLREGWSSQALGLRVFTDSEVFGWTKQRRSAQPKRTSERASSVRETFLADLQVGDLVVHVDHGIGRYAGLVETAVGFTPEQAAFGRNLPPAKAEFLLLEYAQADRLYVPMSQSDRVSRYVGGGDTSPSLTRLGSGEWARAKAKVRRSVRDIAAELMELYGARQAITGHPFPPDTAWQHELEGSFPFEETPDQQAAIREVKADMETARPMDRLLVGDVGFGKTEVALRAAFKAVQDGQQAAVLVPTTVLAQQHFATFRDRLAAFPVRVEMLSRFRSEKEQRQILRGMADGSVDICIGTHRIVSRDVRFKSLGLVVIDEEQRFGVAHKERLKQLRREVDVLTLTATPIPRTLHMGLIGVRDLSILETPPEARLPIRTYVTEYEDGNVAEAIVREIDRGGQVYFVHNRVQGIDIIAGRLRRLVPEARIAVGHGQMPEEELERTMLAFAEGEYDVLVCTTIIESGLDIPNANTLIVNNAHRFGLAQLYQLRGRVGRSSVRAYAYFLFSHDLHLTEVARERLQTILEATELGAGMRIAMKDLEIRGAGNLLGAAQSGHISAVGFDLYTALLAEQVELLKSRNRLPAGDQAVVSAEAVRVSIDLPLPASLPPEFVADVAVRLRLYQRIAGIESDGALAAIVAEIEDRFGALPEPTQNLVYLTSLRLRATAAGAVEIATTTTEIILRLNGPPPVDVHALQRRVGVPVSRGSNQLRIPRGEGRAWMGTLYTLLESLDRSITSVEPAARALAAVSG